MNDGTEYSLTIDRNTFIRVIEIAEKYYGMDAFYFTDDTYPVLLQGKEFGIISIQYTTYAKRAGSCISQQ